MAIPTFVGMTASETVPKAIPTFVGHDRRRT
jgi:hypothetical protein